MPVLSNPRHEAFARAIFVGLCSPNIYPTRGHAYNAAGYRAKDAGRAGGSAEVAACNLLKKVKIFDRVRELQEQAAEHAAENRNHGLSVKPRLNVTLQVEARAPDLQISWAASLMTPRRQRSRLHADDGRRLFLCFGNLVHAEPPLMICDGPT